MMSEENVKPVKILCCYSSADADLLQELILHLSVLRRANLVEKIDSLEVSERYALPKESYDPRIDDADIILLLVSPGFIQSRYGFSYEVETILGRYTRSEAYPALVLLENSPQWRFDIGRLRHLEALPVGGRALRSWPVIDEGLVEVVKGVHNSIRQFRARSAKSLEEAQKRSQIDEIRRSEREQRRHFIEDQIIKDQQKEVSWISSTQPGYTPILVRDVIEKSRSFLEYLYTVKRVEVVQYLRDAEESGDVIDNAAYEAAKNEQARLEERILELERMLAVAALIETNKVPGEVSPGSIVRLQTSDGREYRYTLVGAFEARPSEGLISCESPVGRALLGHRVGDIVIVSTPGGVKEYTILGIE